jgi:hypothetical protein
MPRVPSRVSGSPVGTSRLGTFLVAWLGLSLLSIAWAFASPLGSGPDEPAHFIKAASVVRGQLVGPQGDTGNIVDVPRYVAWTATQDCFRFDITQAADCAPALQGDPAEIVTTETSAGYYNPVYYTLVGWPTLLFSDTSGLYAVRIVSALISSAMLAASFAMVAAWRRRTLPTVGLLVALTPMVIYVNGVANPSAFEITGTLAAFVAMLSIITQPSASLLTRRIVVLVTSGVLALGARTVSPLWVALALAVPLLLLGWSDLKRLLTKRPVVIGTSIIVAAAALAVAWNTLSTRLAPDARSSPSATDGFQVFPDVGASPIFGFLKMITLSVTNGNDMIGNFGWMDTPVPDTTIVVWTVLMGSIVLLAVYFLRAKAAAFGAALILCFFFVPPLIQAAFITTGGYIWQGRYGLPILTMLVFGLAAAVSVYRAGRAPAGGSMTRLVVVVAAVCAYAQGYAFASALHRNVVGSSTAWKEMITRPAWSPPGGVLLVLAVFALGLAVLSVVVVRLRSPEPESPDETKEEHVGSPARTV